MTLCEGFSTLKDPRRRAGLRTPLDSILCMVTLSYLCGYVGYRPLKRFCTAYSKTLVSTFSLKHGIPSHVTFHTVLRSLNEQELIDVFCNWASSFVELSPSEWVSTDGKSMNSTVSDCHSSSQNFQAVVSLFGQESGLTYALDQYRNKSKDKAETDSVRFLMEKLTGMGLVVSMDALHTQKND